MDVKYTRICEVELKPDELAALGRARDVLAQVLSIAKDEGVTEFQVTYEYETYNLDELATCLVTLNDLCHPRAKLVGYCDRCDSK